MLPEYSLQISRLIYYGKYFVPRRCIRDLLNLSHNSKVGGHFATAKELSRLCDLNFKHKTRLVKYDCEG